MINKVEFNTRIASRLDDTDKVYHTNDNIDAIIEEALLTFAAVSGYWKDTILIETKVGQQIYDFLKEPDVKAGYEYISQSLTYQDIIDWIDYDFIGYQDIVDSAILIRIITDAINIFQTKTKLVLDKKTFNVEIGREIVIDDDILDVIAVYFKSVDGNYTALTRADEHNINLINSNWVSNINLGKARYYSINNLSLGKLDLFPRPFEVGEIEVIYVKGKFGSQTSGSNCLIPNNLVPYIKYKVEAELFKLAEDPFRAAYCMQRWEEGLLIGANYAAITLTKLNDINKSLSSFRDFDMIKYGWRNDIETSTKKINGIALAGYNLLAINRIPINVYSILLEVISNAPIELDDIELRDDYIPAFLDYCLHLASIKDGIVAIQNNIPALENFIKVAVNHSIYLQARKISYIDLLQKSKYPIRQLNLSEQKENAA